MEDYEISDVRNRRRTLPPLLSVDIEIEDGFLVYLSVTNIGDQTAEDVTFALSPSLKPWIDKEGPNLFTRGLKYLPPKRNYRLMYDGINEALADEGPNPSQFDISVSYKHPEADQRVTDVFHIDLMDYWNTSVVHSELYDHGKKVKESIEKLTTELTKLNSHVEHIRTISGPTGLDFSISTIKNLRHLSSGEDQLEKLDPNVLDYRVFMEVLGIDRSTALQLRAFFRSRDKNKKLKEVEGMTDDFLEKIEKHFHVEEFTSTPVKPYRRGPRLRVAHVAFFLAACVLIAKAAKRTL